MKKLALALLTLIPLSVSAQQAPKNTLAEGFYASIGAGYADLDRLRPAANTFTRFTDADAAYRVAVGYQYNQNIATELSYSQFGEADTANTTTGRTAKNKVSSYGLAAKLYPTISGPLKPFLKLGVTYLINKENGDNAGAAYTYRESETNGLYGAGIEWLLTDMVRLGLEYEAHGKAGSTTSTEAKALEVKPQVVFLSLTASF